MTRRTGVLHGAALALTLATAGWHFGHALWIEAKARLAQHLIRRAWQQEQAGAGEVRPWPWADTHPVARLVVPGLDIDLMVLAGASGRTLAFGPGHMSGTPLPGERGNAVVSGHRDTHFAFLRWLREADPMVIEGRDGRRHRYVVQRAFVVDQQETWVAADHGDTRLTLVTCYPFDAIRPRGPRRYVVSAVLDREAVSGRRRRGGPGRGSYGPGLRPRDGSSPSTSRIRTEPPPASRRTWPPTGPGGSR